MASILNLSRRLPCSLGGQWILKWLQSRSSAVFNIVFFPFSAHRSEPGQCKERYWFVVAYCVRNIAILYYSCRGKRWQILVVVFPAARSRISISIHACLNYHSAVLYVGCVILKFCDALVGAHLLFPLETVNARCRFADNNNVKSMAMVHFWGGVVRPTI